jgi:hypothetical protein
MPSSTGIVSPARRGSAAVKDGGAIGLGDCAWRSAACSPGCPAACTGEMDGIGSSACLLFSFHGPATVSTGTSSAGERDILRLRCWPSVSGPGLGLALETSEITERRRACGTRKLRSLDSASDVGPSCRSAKGGGGAKVLAARSLPAAVTRGRAAELSFLLRRLSTFA